ncbi:hypothetical protein ACMFMG_008303 [Clarireedia jacksonii]
MVLFSNEDQPELAPYKKETWEEFNAKMNRIQMALAKREAIAEKILAKYPTDRRRKTQEEIDADDAYWFGAPGSGNQSIEEDPAFQKFLKPAEERNKKSLRDKILPAKELKASKARDAEEKAASAKRALAAESSDEEEGRSGLGRAKKMKMAHGTTTDVENNKAAKPLINKALLAANEPAQGNEVINKALLAQQPQEDGDAEGAEVTSKKSKKKKKKAKQKNSPTGDDTEINGEEGNGENADQMDIDTEAFNTFYSKPLIVSPKNNLPADSEKAYEGEGEQESDDDEKSRQEAKWLLKSLRKKEKKQKKREQDSKMDVDNGDSSKPALKVNQDANKKHKTQKTKPPAEKKMDVDVDTKDEQEQEPDDAHETADESNNKKQKKKKSKSKSKSKNKTKSSSPAA